MTSYCIGSMSMSKPNVVGTISDARTLSGSLDLQKACDLVEVRLDEVGADTAGWMRACQGIEAAGFPVILTLRLAREGGKWTGGDTERRDVFLAALETLSCVDVEYTSDLRKEMCLAAEEHGKHIIVSYHNFTETPPLAELQKILNGILECSAAIPKMVTMIQSEDDIATLTQLLHTQRARPLCVIGMGDKGTKTRMAFPAIGSCLTYGHLDRPSAPGQWPSSLLAEKLRYVVPEYNEAFIIRHKVLEFV